MTERKTISVCKNIIEQWGEIKATDFIEEVMETLNELDDEAKGSAVISMENETLSEYVRVVLTYNRPETDAEMATRIALETRNLERIQRQRKENQVYELKQKFLDGKITASEYERKSAALMK